jgi:6-phosphogluconolactonase
MVEVFANLEAMSRAGAELFARLCEEAVRARGRFSVALSGGSTPRGMYELLAKPPLRERVVWDSVHVFWGDERWVPQDDPRSNYGAAMRALLDLVPIPPEQVHPVAYLASPEASASAYEAELRRYFGQSLRFDLVLLGMGADGHTASLFPGTPALGEHRKWATWVQAADVPRVTLTADVINQAGTVAFLVAGADKAATLKRVMGQAGSGVDLLPAQLIRPVGGELRWLLDTAAASQLKL